MTRYATLRRVGSDIVDPVRTSLEAVQFLGCRVRTCTSTDNHCLAYSNAGSIVSPSFVPPGSTIEGEHVNDPRQQAEQR
jgi:hypothetical protein